MGIHSNVQAASISPDIEETRDQKPREDDLRFLKGESVEPMNRDCCSDSNIPNNSTHIKRARSGAEVWHEKNILRDVAHPHIISLHGSSLGGSELYIEQGHHDLYDHIAESPGVKLDADEVLSIAHDVSGAVSHIHGLGYCHNDIKAENVVMCHRPFESKEWHPKVIDFEFAHKVDEKPPEGENMVAGTHAYYSPQKLDDAGDPGGDHAAYCRQAADNWALGVTLHLAAFGRFPNGTGSPEPILNADYKAPQGTDPRVATVLEGLLTVDPGDRWTAAEANAYLAELQEPSSDSEYSWSDVPRLLNPSASLFSRVDHGTRREDQQDRVDVGYTVSLT